MENENKPITEVKEENKEAKKLNLPLVISAAVGGVAIIAIVLTIALGGNKNNQGANGGESSSTGENGDGTVDDGILNEDNIDPNGWTKIDK